MPHRVVLQVRTLSCPWYPLANWVRYAEARLFTAIPALLGGFYSIWTLNTCTFVHTLQDGLTLAQPELAECQPIAWIIAWFDLAVNTAKTLVSHLVILAIIIQADPICSWLGILMATIPCKMSVWSCFIEMTLVCIIDFFWHCGTGTHLQIIAGSFSG